MVPESPAGLAQQAGVEHDPPSRVLILGPPEVADLIARELVRRGFDPVIFESHRKAASQPTPSLADPDAAQALRAILREFAGARKAKAGAESGRSRDFVHPGVSAWAERPELVTLGQEAGLEVIAPSVRVLSLFSSTLNLLSEAERVGIPNLLLSPDPLHGIREIEQLSRKMGNRFPFILKAVRTGGHHGMCPGHCVVHDSEDLSARVPLWMEQLRRSSGEVLFLAERYLEGARHIVVPFARMRQGRSGEDLRFFPWIDASLQCRHRKLIEFCPVQGLDPAAEKQIGRWVADLARACGYVGVGNLEFLVDGSRAFLINGSARLNLSFHLWERVAGTSAVAWQLAAQDFAARPGPDKPERKYAHGLALRIFAEDPLLQLPQPGEIEEATGRSEWDFPAAAAEASLLVGPGDSIPPQSSGFLGLIWAWGADRKQALTIARGVLDEFWIAGSLQTNERFLGELLSHPWVREGIFHSGFVDEEFLPSVRPPVELVRLFGSVCEQIPRALPPAKGAPADSGKWAVGDQWARPSSEGSRWIQGPEFRKMNSMRGVSGMIELSDGSRRRVLAFPLAKDRWQVRIGPWAMSVRRVPPAGEGAKRPSRLLALVSGRVHSVLYREGARVPAHEPLLLIESLGMLVPHALPSEVRILRWFLGPEDQVRAGEELAEFENAARN